MKFLYGKQAFCTRERGEENCYLMTNGLGGFSSQSMLGSCTRNDHTLFMSCKKSQAPNHRYHLIHRMEEVLEINGEKYFLSTQQYVDGNKEEEGYRHLSFFEYEDYPVWLFQIQGIEVRKKVLFSPTENKLGISYEIRKQNRRLNDKQVRLTVTPYLEFVPKGQVLAKEQEFWLCLRSSHQGSIRSNGQELMFATNGKVRKTESIFHNDLFYEYDKRDGRTETGCCVSNHHIEFNPKELKEGRCVLVYRLPEEPEFAGEWEESDLLNDQRAEYDRNAGEVLEQEILSLEEEIVSRRKQLVKEAGFQDETANALVVAANQFIAYRASTGEKTILAGFPFFEDWGRDTMISLMGCCISTGQRELTESILETFMKNCQKGLMPNLFPEGKESPRYNTVDASLLFILAVYEYYKKFNNTGFVEHAWSVMEEIIRNYTTGTDYRIGMEKDGLIHAGQGFDQVTWMDVRIGDILPTPRHGKPVEINAYWYNALCIMDFFAEKLHLEAKQNYRDMAVLAQKSFREQFWNPEKNCLRDVVSGDLSGADDQIRCNQIWAVSLPFSVLTREQEKSVVDVVTEKLYTPLGLRTLDPADSQFHPFYGGSLFERDTAYHQGTVWTFPLGGYYLAYLKVYDDSGRAKEEVREQLKSITAALKEGCIGQLPEIYDGLEPVFSKGCFAQAWSVGEILRVYEALEKKI